MSSSPSEETSPLLALSNDLAAAVERAGSVVVAVNARQRIPSSGVHWRSGVVVTADHTVRCDEDITITLPDNRTVPATLAGRDSSTDLAVLKLQQVELPAAEIGDASLLKVGQMVLAVARAGESGLNASLGVISGWYGGQIDQLVHLDLTLYPGFSGGPLVDTQGRIVGINTSSPRRMVLAIPASTVNRVVDQLLQKGRIARGYLGLGMQPVRLPDNLKRTLNLPSVGGVIVVNVEPDGPADQSGVLIGDVLVALDRTPVSDTGDVQAILGCDRVGKTVSAEVIRGGKSIELAITVGERPRREE